MSDPVTDAPLRAARKGKGLTLRQVAEAVGISEGHLSRVETSVEHAESLPLGKALRLAERVGIEPAEIVEGSR
ncbi:MAG: helix-turn-helix domain-containing protein [Pseudomonadota bacterium]